MSLSQTIATFDRTKAQNSAQLSQYNPTIAGGNGIFATSMGPQDAFTVAKIAGGEFVLLSGTQGPLLRTKICRYMPLAGRCLHDWLADARQVR
jgi:hypothetical protein